MVGFVLWWGTVICVVTLSILFIMAYVNSPTGDIPQILKDIVVQLGVMIKMVVLSEHLHSAIMGSMELIKNLVY